MNTWIRRDERPTCILVFCELSGVSLVSSGYTSTTKYLYTICTMSPQRLRRWSDIVQML